MGIDAQTIEAGDKAIQTVSKGGVYPVIVSLICLVMVVYMIWDNGKRNDKQIVLMQQISDQLNNETERWRVLNDFMLRYSLSSYPATYNSASKKN